MRELIDEAVVVDAELESSGGVSGVSGAPLNAEPYVWERVAVVVAKRVNPLTCDGRGGGDDSVDFG